MCVCQHTSEHCLLVITTTVPLFVSVCQDESVFNQEDRKTESTENYWICFHRRDNYQIKQIHLVKQIIHLSNQQAGQRQQHLLPSGDLRQMWRCGDDPLSALLFGFEGGLFHPFEVLHLAWKGECNPVYKFYFSCLWGKLIELYITPHFTFHAKFCII